MEGLFFKPSKSTDEAFAFTAFNVAACIARLATGLNVALAIIFSKSGPGVNTKLTALILAAVKVDKSSALSQLSEAEKDPN